jgi:hypothetical protein
MKLWWTYLTLCIIKPHTVHRQTTELQEERKETAGREGFYVADGGTCAYNLFQARIFELLN